jgi:hypothetical protein
VTAAISVAGIRLSFKSKIRSGKAGVRKSCREFQGKSRRNLLWKAANCQNFKPSVMAVCTYHGVMQDGKQSKSHLNHYFVCFRRDWPGHKYLWVAEFQRRGALHFHIFVDIQQADVEEFHDWHVKTWVRVSDQAGDGLAVRHAAYAERLRKPHAVIWYCLKEAAKRCQKEFPPGVDSIGRWWGTSRSVRVLDVIPLFIEDKFIPLVRAELAKHFRPNHWWGRFTLCRRDVWLSVTRAVCRIAESCAAEVKPKYRIRNTERENNARLLFAYTHCADFSTELHKS